MARGVLKWIKSFDVTSRYLHCRRLSRLTGDGESIGARTPLQLDPGRQPWTAARPRTETSDEPEHHIAEQLEPLAVVPRAAPRGRSLGLPQARRRRPLGRHHAVRPAHAARLADDGTAAELVSR